MECDIKETQEKVPFTERDWLVGTDHQKYLGFINKIRSCSESLYVCKFTHHSLPVLISSLAPTQTQAPFSLDSREILGGWAAICISHSRENLTNLVQLSDPDWKCGASLKEKVTIPAPHQSSGPLPAQDCHLQSRGLNDQSYIPFGVKWSLTIADFAAGVSHHNNLHWRIVSPALSSVTTQLQARFLSSY